MEKGIAFYCYRVKGQKIRIGVQTNGAKCNKMPFIPEDNEERGFVVAPFDKEKSYYSIIPEIEIEGDATSPEMEAIVNKASCPNKTDEQNVCHCMSKEEYMAMVENAKWDISNGKYDKIVLSRAITKEKTEDWNCWEEFLSLTRKYENAFVSMFHIPGRGLWMGATPELLLKREGTKGETMALAGTRKANSSTDWDTKNIAEHIYVSKFIGETIEKHSKTYEIGAMETTRPSAHIEHLRTNFGMESDTNGFFDILNELHPTPAVCGTPQPICLKEIPKKEKYDREFYGGVVGPIYDSQSFELYVNIRCMKVTKDKFIIYAGGGITIDSEPENEWKETELKAKTIIEQ